jgi:hypothetical protein
LHIVGCHRGIELRRLSLSDTASYQLCLDLSMQTRTRPGLTIPKELGADGYIVKPIQRDQLLPLIAEILAEQVTVSFWGVHGTLPVPGLGSLRYGGNQMPPLKRSELAADFV